jgi:hypothetical protein
VAAAAMATATTAAVGAQLPSPKFACVHHPDCIRSQCMQHTMAHWQWASISLNLLILSAVLLLPLLLLLLPPLILLLLLPPQRQQLHRAPGPTGLQATAAGRPARQSILRSPAHRREQPEAVGAARGPQRLQRHDPAGRVGPAVPHGARTHKQQVRRVTHHDGLVRDACVGIVPIDSAASGHALNPSRRQ